MLGGQMLHDNERHAGIGRQRFEQLRVSLEPACGRADADDHQRRVMRRNHAAAFGRSRPCRRLTE